MKAYRESVMSLGFAAAYYVQFDNEWWYVFQNIDGSWTGWLSLNKTPSGKHPEFACPEAEDINLDRAAVNRR